MKSYFGTASVTLEFEASPSEMASVEEVLRQAGFQYSIKAPLMRRSHGELPWVIILAIPLWHFMSSFGREAGKTAWKEIYRLIRKLCKARRNMNGEIAFEDKESSAQIILNPNLPEEAYRQLVQIPKERLLKGYWVWDFEQNCWVDHNEFFFC